MNMTLLTSNRVGSFSVLFEFVRQTIYSGGLQRFDYCRAKPISVHIAKLILRLMNRVEVYR